MFHGVLKSWRLPIAALFVVAAPTVALAARGYATATVSMRAGPGAAYPIVTRVPGGAHLTIHGCLSGYNWCDVSWHHDRGWVRAAFLDYFYRNRYVYLPDYVDEIDVPIVTFVLSDYWDNYYVGRPFFHRRAYFAQHWRDHGSVGISSRSGHMTRSDRNAGFIGRTGREGRGGINPHDRFGARGGLERNGRSDRFGMRERGGFRADREGMFGRHGARVATPNRGMDSRGSAQFGGPGGHGPQFGGHDRGNAHVGGPGAGFGGQTGGNAHIGGFGAANSPARLGGPPMGGGGHGGGMGAGPRMGGGGQTGGGMGRGPGGGGPGGHGPHH